jgi:hypothetical protein
VDNPEDYWWRPVDNRWITFCGVVDEVVESAVDDLVDRAGLRL